MDLVYKNEKKLFAIAVTISGLFWLALVLGTIGIALIYFLFGYLFFLFAHSAFITHIKGTGVKISQEQYPDLYKSLVNSCEKVGLEVIPDAYLLRTDFFNALATRFLGRNFVVLYTDVVDALEDQSSAVDFYIGHELGHIHRNHLLWSFFILPSSILPLLGAALRRAEEYTCDRYGVACCQSEDDIKAAISAIAAGDTRWKSINVDAYLAQISETNGFWMSFNELISDYPWLTKRMAAALAMNEGREINHPSRHAFAWFLSLFVPRFGSGGGMVSLMITIAIVGILAAVAIPAYQDYVQKARYTEVYIDAEAVSKEVTEYAVVNQAWPESLQTLGYSENYISNATQSSQIAIYENGVIGAQVGINEEGKEQYIVLEPYVEEGNVYWSCYGENLLVKHLPSECQ